jgi:hypothetical protein
MYLSIAHSPFWVTQTEHPALKKPTIKHSRAQKILSGLLCRFEHGVNIEKGDLHNIYNQCIPMLASEPFSAHICLRKLAYLRLVRITVLRQTLLSSKLRRNVLKTASDMYVRNHPYTGSVVLPRLLLIAFIYR